MPAPFLYPRLDLGPQEAILGVQGTPPGDELTLNATHYIMLLLQWERPLYGTPSLRILLTRP